MRTRTRVCLLALCAALLTGCGGRTAGAKAYDPAAAAQALLDAGYTAGLLGKAAVEKV